MNPNNKKEAGIIINENYDSGILKKISAKEAVQKLQSAPYGLTSADAKQRAENYGLNELKEIKKITALHVLFQQFGNFIIYVLLAAAVISLIIGEILNFWVIISIIGFVVILGFIQEYKAEKAMEALKHIVEPVTRVMRDGRLTEIPTKEIVPGDILVLDTGDNVPADAKIIELNGMKVDESALTGESAAVEKKESELIFAGTQIVHGRCKAIVIATGMGTELGKIAEMIQDKEEDTPLQIKIKKLTKTLAVIALFSCLLTFGIGAITGAPLAEMLVIALALAVAAVPEGLPLTLTLTLAFGVNRMAKQKAIVRKMLGVETLGSTTVICTDKTGTLTKNEMTVEKLFINNQYIAVSGSGYEPTGGFYMEEKEILLKKDSSLGLLLKASALCTNSALEKKEGIWRAIGDPTEVALITAAAKAGVWKDDIEEKSKRLSETDFTSERKMMSVVYKEGSNNFAYIKGAPEMVLEKCKSIFENGKIRKIREEERQGILNANTSLAKDAYRVLGLAYKKLADAKGDAEKEMIFLGLAAMIDPAREGVKEAIDTCKTAGIKVIMITGDNEETAKAIGKKIGIYAEKDNLIFEGIKDKRLKGILGDGTITGKELEELSEEEFDDYVEDICIYARTMPEQKLKIIRALKKKGHIIAMTGDGVNDAPALKNADIGIAMGLKGTDVAKESSTIVLQDDNFSTIVEAVKQGRTIYDNIEKFTTYLISRNFTEVIVIILGLIFLGFETLPLLALQILFINTFDEIMPSIGLGLDNARKEVMNRMPRKPGEPILKKRNLFIIISIAIFIASASFLVFMLENPISGIEKARTLTFASIVSVVFFVPFAFRSLTQPIFKLKPWENKILIIGMLCTLTLTLSAMYIPYLQKIFSLSTLSLIDWIWPISVALAALLFTEFMKFITTKIKQLN